MTSGTWRRLITFVLTFELAFAPLAAFAHEKKEGEADDEISDTSQAKKMLEPILEMARKMDSGETIEVSSTDVDMWSMLEQYVEIFDGTKEPTEEQTPTSTYRLDQASLKRPRPSFTQLRAKVDPKLGHLVLEATRGENDKGEHGVLVARMHVPRARNLVAMTRDAEILSMIDQSGRLNVVDWGYAAATAFVAPLQVHRNLWRPMMPPEFSLANANVEASYITRGTRTLDATNLYAPDLTFPVDADNKPMHRPGDLVLKVDGKLFAVLARSNFHRTIQEEQAILFSLRQWLEDDPKGMKALAEVLKQADEEFDGFLDKLRNVENMGADPLFAKALMAIPPAALKAMRARIADHSNYLQRPDDAMSADQHDIYFRDIEQNAAAMNIADDETMRVDWQKLVTRRNQTRAQQLAVENEDPSVQKARDRKYFMTMAKVAATLVVAMASPQLYEHSELLQHFAPASWIYQNAVPPVLKDAAYRWPLIGHVISMTAIWPASPALSRAFGAGFRALGASLQNTKGVVSGKVRDFARVWGDMHPWKRIVASGLRAYSFLILTPIVRVIEQLMQQRALIPAMSLAINPAEVITPESEIGQMLDLKEAMTVGFNKMTVRGAISFLTVGILPESKVARAKAQDTQDLKMRALSEVYQRNKMRHNYSRLLADLVVAEHFKIPASVLQEAQRKKGFNLSDLKILAENPQARRMRELVDDELRQRIAELPAMIMVDDQIINAQEYLDHLEIARQTAQKIDKMWGGRKYVREMLIKTRAKSLAVWNYLLNQGRDQADFLYNVMPNVKAWKNTQREFIIDHLMVVFMPALWGDRANYAKPDQMAADPHGLFWSSGVGMQDVVANASAHFFRAGASFMLQFQVVKAVTESLYEPIGKVINRVVYRDREGHPHEGVPATDVTADPQFNAYLEPQGFFAGIGQFGKGMFNFAESDIGGVAHRYVKTNFDMIFAYFYFGMFFRLALGQQGLRASFIGLSIQWLLWPTFVASWWWFLQKGTNMYGDHFEAKQDNFLLAQNTLAQAAREADPVRAELLRKEGIWQMYLMYDEGAPEAIASEFHPLTTQASLEEQAAYWSDLATRKSPGAMTINRWMPWLATSIAAVGSTYGSITPLVWSTSPDMQTWTMMALAGAEFAVVVPLFVFLFSKKTWSERIPNFVMKIKSMTTGCQDSLAAR